MNSKALANNFRGDAISPLQSGDIVRTGTNLHPHYRVIAVSDDRVWVRDIQYGTDHIVTVEQINKIF